MNILISGASVAGLTAAYWLTRHSHRVTVVERAPGLRRGGQAIDVRGPALEVAERTGVLDDFRRLSTEMRGMSMVDPDGNEVFRSTETTLTGGDLSSPDVEIMRDDLCGVLHSAVGDRAEYLFDDSITAVTQDEHAAHVTFERAEPRSFDLVVGADGLHSTTRRLVFSPEERFVRRLGDSYMAVFTTPNFLDLDRWQIFQQGTTVGGGVMTARGNTEARVYLGFTNEEPLSWDHRDIDAQKRLVAERLAGARWVIPQALEYMWDAPDFHFDGMSQVHMDSWSSGRVVLLGDAGYCGSPLSGQGTSMAIVGGYVLAGELTAANGDHEAAFAAYEAELREYVAANQQLALTNKARIEAEQAGQEHDFPAFADVVGALKLKDYGRV